MYTIDTPRSPPELEVWGGVECTVNRVGERYFSQLDERAYTSGVDDLARFAGLGIRTLRYPVLWERVEGQHRTRPDWTWSDAHLGALRELGMRPIVGLVHHGSGPRDTSLVDPAFPEKLAAYAGRVAARYPWVDHYTPVNEPLTTARFSGLYGLWYPHGRDAPTFWKALSNQCRGIVLSMRAIERVNPDARLVQTDDLSTTYATPALAYQAAFNNELRWLSWDLVCGRVGRTHPLWHWLRESCLASEAELAWFVANPRPPDLIGINHYVTSDRFLDHEVARHPPHCEGGNGRDRYADVEAARTIVEPVGDIAPLLTEAWQRYGLPVAITEAHIDATREDQLRWLAGLWAGADQARRAGADIRAVTVWSLLGSYDWNSLLTACDGYYEAGAFDVRGGHPRATALATAIRDLAHGRPAVPPAIEGAGWWQRSQRFAVHPLTRAGVRHDAAPSLPTPDVIGSCILIVGANGRLGRSFARACAERDLPHRVLDRAQLDIADDDAVEAALDRFRPWAVVNAAGYARIDDAERDGLRCFRENVSGPDILARLCARHDVALMTFSSDMVFDGERCSPYVEKDAVSPLSVYGRSKAQAEALVMDRHPGALVVRTSTLFGSLDGQEFLDAALKALRAGHAFRAGNHRTLSPTYLPDLVDACLDLLIDREGGIWHLTNGDAVTWVEFARRAARLARVDCRRLHAHADQPGPRVAMRPRYSVLGSERAFSMPGLDDALGRYLAMA